jgi:hypothetical protein
MSPRHLNLHSIKECIYAVAPSPAVSIDGRQIRSGPTQRLQEKSVSVMDIESWSSRAEFSHLSCFIST